jgi:hypothetical protein
MGGEVPQTRSTWRTLRPIRKEEHMKLKKLKMRWTKLLCRAA